MERDRDEQVEVELAAVVGGEGAVDVDLARVELCRELDLLRRVAEVLEAIGFVKASSRGVA